MYCSRMGNLEGKGAIVSSAGHGIGRGHALERAARGASVVVNDAWELLAATRDEGGVQ